MDGFAREFQTGAEGFGRKVSMTCDHPAINPALQKDQDARTTILRLFERKAEGIYPEGAHLWVYRDGDAMPDEHDGTQSEKLRAALAAVPAANLDCCIIDFSGGLCLSNRSRGRSPSTGSRRSPNSVCGRGRSISIRHRWWGSAL